MEQIQNHQILKTYPNHREVFADIDRLDQAFRKHFRRAPKSELVYSESGTAKKPVFGLAVWYDNGDETELEWFKGWIIGNLEQ